jgi:putative pyruvate formate lyase activating enzyme
MCEVCPRKCKIDRLSKKGFCGMGPHPVVAKACLHKWEEPCVSGTNGSGTVFFSGCNLKCVYCQNFRISQENFGMEISIEKLSSIFISLQQEGAHNINLVNPTHFVMQIKESLIKSEALRIPIIYNTNGYETKKSLNEIKGLIDVYLPDLKYYSSEVSRKFSKADDYFEVATSSILDMYGQVGNPEFQSNGIIKKGLIIRHLILPGHTSESIKILEWIKSNLPDSVYISLMSQYTPCYKTECFPEIDRHITRREYEKVVNCLYKLGLKNGYVQDRESADEQYIPDFNLQGVD